MVAQDDSGGRARAHVADNQLKNRSLAYLNRLRTGLSQRQPGASNARVQIAGRRVGYRRVRIQLTFTDRLQFDLDSAFRSRIQVAQVPYKQAATEHGSRLGACETRSTGDLFFHLT